MVVVADASPLIGLARIDQLDLLRQLFQQILIPESVELELHLDSSRPGAKVLRGAREAGWLVIRRITEVPAELLAVVDRGEAEAITLAKKESALLLIDDARGRVAARSNKVRIFGTGAVLIKAKQGGYIPKVADPLASLSEAGYHLADRLQEEILRLAGE